MRVALDNPSGPVFELSPEMLAEGLAASHASPRRRILFPMHRGQADLVQRMINFLQPGTYIQPHRHPRESASETILVMQGEMGFLIFDGSGKIESVHRIPPGGVIDIEASVWHGVVALAPDTVILEIKRGPYDDSDKVFATWAPPEDSDERAAYQASLEALFSD